MNRLQAALCRMDLHRFDPWPCRVTLDRMTDSEWNALLKRIGSSARVVRSSVSVVVRIGDWEELAHARALVAAKPPGAPQPRGIVTAGNRPPSSQPSARSATATPATPSPSKARPAP